MLKIDKFDKIIVANWKLNGSINFIEQYLKELNCRELKKSRNCGIICTPSVYLHKLAGKLNPLFLGGQDCSNYNEGAYTGEVSASMLKDVACQFCIVGHSERRKVFGQSNEDICIKVKNLIEHNLSNWDTSSVTNMELMFMYCLLGLVKLLEQQKMGM